MFQRSKILKSMLAASAFIATAGVAAAETPTELGRFNDWAAVSYPSPNGKVCYAVSRQISEAPSTLNHGINFFVITQRRGQNVTLEPQFIASYSLQEGSKASVTVDGKSFSFFASAKSAWSENAAEDPSIIAALKAGSKMTVKAVSAKGNDVTYIYSLSGVTAALGAVQSCQ